MSERRAREFWIEHCLTDDEPEWAVNNDPKTKQLSGPREVIHVREVLPDEASELAELRRDRARLEWLIENKARLKQWNTGLWTVILHDERRMLTLDEPTPRAAIDAAMKKDVKENE